MEDTKKLEAILEILLSIPLDQWDENFNAKIKGKDVHLSHPTIIDHANLIGFAVDSVVIPDIDGRITNYYNALIHYRENKQIDRSLSSRIHAVYETICSPIN